MWILSPFGILQERVHVWEFGGNGASFGIILMLFGPEFGLRPFAA
jgi:hypothetical protein